VLANPPIGIAYRLPPRLRPRFAIPDFMGVSIGIEPPFPMCFMPRFPRLAIYHLFDPERFARRFRRIFMFPSVSCCSRCWSYCRSGLVSLVCAPRDKRRIDWSELFISLS